MHFGESTVVPTVIVKKEITSSSCVNVKEEPATSLGCAMISFTQISCFSRHRRNAPWCISNSSISFSKKQKIGKYRFFTISSNEMLAIRVSLHSSEESGPFNFTMTREESIDVRSLFQSAPGIFFSFCLKPCYDSSKKNVETRMHIEIETKRGILIHTFHLYPAGHKYETGKKVTALSTQREVLISTPNSSLLFNSVHIPPGKEILGSPF